MPLKDKDKKREYNRMWKENNPEKVKEYRKLHYHYDPDLTREYQLKALYGISNSDYEFILSSQGGVCAICGLPNNGRNFAIDHDHETGKIRGLLCVGCNAGIGSLKDDVNLVRRALEYLVKNAIR